MYQNVATKVLTGECRLSYCTLTQPRAIQEGQTPKYSVTLLIPKTDTATKADIDQSIQAAAQAAAASKWGGFIPPDCGSIVHDGDGVKSDGKPYGDECKGHWVLTASSVQQPGVVHVSNVKANLIPDDIYSGMYARVTINFYGYNTANRKGVACGLGNVLKTREGERLSGGASAEMDFANLEQTLPPQQPQAPMGYAPPAPQYQPPAQPAYPQQFAPQTEQPPMQPQQGYQQQVNINPLTGQPL